MSERHRPIPAAAALALALALAAACAPGSPAPGPASPPAGSSAPAAQASSAVPTRGSLAIPTMGSPAVTEVIVYQPVAPPAAVPSRTMTCTPSAVLPDRGAYRCEDAQGALDPCFPMADGNLACLPNPALNSQVVVAPASPPAPAPVSGGPLPFTLQLVGGLSCDLFAGPPKSLAGEPVTYACNAPGAWLVGPLDSGGAQWKARQVWTDSQGNTVTAGPATVAVAKAWVY